MLFAHGPLGFLSATPLQKYWKKLQKSERLFLLTLGGLAAASPDLDLLYFYFVSADSSHRHFFTHTPIFWLGLGFLIYAFGKLIKKRMLGWSGIVIGLGGISHIFGDSITGRAAWLWPFSDWLLGLSSISWLPTWYFENTLFTRFTLEGIIIVGFLLVLIRMLVKKTRTKNILFGVTASIGIIGFTTLVFSNQHVAHINPNAYHNDIDSDGLPNLDDVDIDGDGLNNSYDKDANGDGLENIDQIAERAKSMKGVWYAPFGGRGFEQIRRLGFINNGLLAPYVFDDFGRIIGPEMEEDFVNNPGGYINSPEDYDFRRQNENLLAFLTHTDKLLGPKTTPKAGDVVFIQKGGSLYVAIGVFDKPAGLLYTDPDIPTDIYSWDSIQGVGEVTAVGRFH